MHIRVTFVYSMHIHTSQVHIIFIILEASIYDEGVLSKGFMSRKSLCPDGVMSGGGFVPDSLIRMCWSVNLVHYLDNVN